MIPLSLNGSMNIYKWPWHREHFAGKITKLLHSMKRVMKKVPLLPKSAKKDTLFSDLLRSEPHSEKGTLFCEFLNMHVNTYSKCGPPGYLLLKGLWVLQVEYQWPPYTGVRGGGGQKRTSSEEEQFSVHAIFKFAPPPALNNDHSLTTMCLY